MYVDNICNKPFANCERTEEQRRGSGEQFAHLFVKINGNAILFVFEKFETSL